MGAAATFITCGAEFAGLWALFWRFGNLRGWTFAEVGLLYGQVTVGFGSDDIAALSTAQIAILKTTAIAAARSAMSGSRTANSSPPSLATVSASGSPRRRAKWAAGNSRAAARTFRRSAIHPTDSTFMGWKNPN